MKSPRLGWGIITAYGLADMCFGAYVPERFQKKYKESFPTLFRRFMPILDREMNEDPGACYSRFGSRLWEAAVQGFIDRLVEDEIQKRNRSEI